jgi:tetratricopeptide (TPR) repeat protein
VETLVRRRVLHAAGDRLEFVHDRIRDVAFADLLPLRRAVLHRRLAESMEALYATDLDPHCLAIGTHYAEGEVWTKAVAFLRRAGSAAAGRSASREAAASFERALAALEHWPPERMTTEQAIDLRLDLVRAYYPLARHAERLTLAEEAERLATGIDDPVRLGWAHLGVSAVRRVLADYDRAIERGQRALGVAEICGDRGLRVHATYTLALAHLDAQRSGPAIELFRAVTALTADETMADDPTRDRYLYLRQRALACLAPSLAELGEFREALRYGEEALRLAADTRPHDLIRAVHCLAMVHYHRGDTARAQPLFEREVRLAQAAEDETWLATAYAGLGRTLARSGRGEEAVPLLERAVAMVTATHTWSDISHRHRQLGEAYLVAGRVAQALERGASALELARRHGERAGEALSLALIADALVARPSPDGAGAERHYREALEGAMRLGRRPLTARCHLGLGRLYRRTGDPGRAREHLEMALTMYRGMELDLWAEQAAQERKHVTYG